MRRTSGAELPAPAPDATPSAESLTPVGRVGYTFSSELMTIAPGHSRTVIAIEALATEVIAKVLDAGRRGLAICGVSEGVGVTFTAANLAVAISRAGVPTLLIDGNMRHPTLQRIIAPSDERPGLSELLGGKGDISLADVLCPEVLPNLSLIYAGAVAPDAAELLAGDAFRSLVRGCLRDYALTIVDTPPANRWADARIICKLTTYAMVVARRDATFIDDVATLAGELKSDGITLVGAIMNQV
jgi:protein-tyrosine kinase